MNEPNASDGKAGHGRDWTEQAACLDADPTVFVEAATDEHVAQALTTCARCPVTRDCLDTALAHHQIGDIGIWGGTTPDVRDQIRAGTLTRDDARHLQTGPYRPGGDRPPMVAVTPNHHGDYTDGTGRVLITRLPAGDYMAFIDQRPIARTTTLIDACQAAHAAQEQGPVTRRHAAQPQTELIEVHVDEHGDHVDASSRILITRVSTEPPYLVFLDNRLHGRTETLNSARAAAPAALSTEANTRDLTATPRTSVQATRADQHSPEGRPQVRINTAAEQTESVGRTR